MTRRSKEELTPKNGHVLVVGIVARISGCQNQKELSLEDQEDHAKEEVADLYQGPVEYRVIATKGKGEQLDRPELRQIEDMVRSRELDLLVMEDTGRMVRGTEAVRLWGIAVDHGTRCIAPDDRLDTADETWEEDLISACRDHVGHNAHTSKRLKKKLMNRFKKWSSLARKWSGVLLNCLRFIMDCARRMTWKGQSPELLQLPSKDYPTGVKLTRKQMRPWEERLERSAELPKFDLTIKPKSAVN